MSRKLKTKYILILVVISFLLIRVLIVLPEDWVATNFFNGLFGVAYNHLPDKIYCNRNCYEIKNAVLNKKNNGEWDINTGNKWYPIKDITCNDGILEKSLRMTVQHFTDSNLSFIKISLRMSLNI